MKTYIFPFIFILLLLPTGNSFIQAKPQKDIQGFNDYYWGMSIEQVQQKSGKLKLDEEMNAKFNFDGNAPFYWAPNSKQNMPYQFHHNKLERIIIYISSNSEYQKILKDLYRKYGIPASVNKKYFNFYKSFVLYTVNRKNIIRWVYPSTTIIANSSTFPDGAAGHIIFIHNNSSLPFPY